MARLSRGVSLLLLEVCKQRKDEPEAESCRGGAQHGRHFESLSPAFSLTLLHSSPGIWDEDFTPWSLFPHL